MWELLLINMFTKVIQLTIINYKLKTKFTNTISWRVDAVNTFHEILKLSV